MHMKSLEDLFLDTLKDTYDAEQQITKALPKMAKAATNPELKQGFEEHLRQTEQHVQRLERAFEMLGHKAKAKHCNGMEGLLKEGDEMVKDQEKGDVLDAGLIAAAQRVEHYEIAVYGTICTYAELLGLGDLHNLLGQTLNEEELTDKKLTQIARTVNVQAI